MESEFKKNVSEFNKDILENGSYQYTLTPSFSSFVANNRLTDVTEDIIRTLPDVQTVLDAGCGDGTYTAELKGRLPALSFTGFDPASMAIKKAQTRYPNCRFFEGNILNLSTFPQETFDLVIIRGVIHHLPTQRAALANAAKIGKYVLVIEPNGNNPILKWIEKHSAYHIQHEEQSFTSHFLVNLCHEVGLSVSKLSFVGFIPFFFPTLPARIIFFFQPLLEKVPGLAKWFGGQVVILAKTSDASL